MVTWYDPGNSDVVDASVPSDYVIVIAEGSDVVCAGTTGGSHGGHSIVRTTVYDYWRVGVTAECGPSDLVLPSGSLDTGRPPTLVHNGFDSVE